MDFLLRQPLALISLFEGHGKQPKLLTSENHSIIANENTLGIEIPSIFIASDVK